MRHGKFEKVGKTEKRMYGKRQLLVCGYPPGEQSALLSLLEQIGLGDLPVVFTRAGDSEKTLKAVMNSDDRTGLGQESPMKRAVIMSGLTQNELHALMSAYRTSGMHAQLWASLTPISENWTVDALLNELQAESEAMKKKRKGR
jgi:hypothetical protein